MMKKLNGNVKTNNSRSQFLISILFFVFVFTSTSGCTLIQELSMEASTVVQSDIRYKTLIQRSEYTEYQFDFVTNQDRLILADMGNVEVLDLKTVASILKREVFEDGIESIHVAKDQTSLYLFTQYRVQLWSTQDWHLLKELEEDKYAERIVSFSKDESLLFFAGRLRSAENFEPIYELGRSPAMTGAAISADNQYFVETDHHSAMPVIDINNRKWTGISYTKTGYSMASFRDNKSFFASYGAKIDLHRGGYFSSALGVFSATEKNQIESFKPKEKITCWTYDPEYGVLLSLYDGDIYLLNDNLDIQFKWHIDDFARSCTLAKPGEIWLGGNKTGIYRADLKNRRITREYETNNPVYTIKVADDGRYVGIVESPSAKSIITVLAPVTR
jgi:hypothetical protein